MRGFKSHTIQTSARCKIAQAFVAQSAERKPFKLVAVGSSPTEGKSENDFKLNTADVAQSVERKPFKLVAVGSSPTVGKQNFFNFAAYYALMAKWTRRPTSNREIVGSTPTKGTGYDSTRCALSIFKPIRMGFESSHSLN